VFYWLEADYDADGDDEVEENAAALFTTTGDILTAIDYAAELGVDAMNMSIGTPPIPPQGNQGGTKAVYQTVIQSAVSRGSLVVVSAGNSSADLQHGGTFTLPNSVAGAMSISATGPNDELVFYSNYGTNEISVGAPGGGYETLEKTLSTDPSVAAWPFPTNLVFNAYMGDDDGDSLLESPTYAWLAGTSMAAPQVTGAAALVREVAPNANAKQVEQAIEQGADLVQGKNDTELGAGRLNAAAALDAATNGG
jgi:subtilisin family serine protease